MRTLTPERLDILAAMESGQSYTPTAIAEALGKERSSVTQMMQKLVRSGHLLQRTYGRYFKVEPKQ